MHGNDPAYTYNKVKHAGMPLHVCVWTDCVYVPHLYKSVPVCNCQWRCLVVVSINPSQILPALFSKVVVQRSSQDDPASSAVGIGSRSCLNGNLSSSDDGVSSKS